MAQTGNFSPIQLYSSSTPGNAPAVGNLVNSTLGSELAINIADGKLFYKDSSNAIQVIGWKTTPTTAGGTGLTSYTAGDMVYWASGTAFSKLTIGSANYIMTSSGTAPQWSASIGPAQGGTGITSYAVGDLIYASGTTRLSKLADVATGNALISGGVGVAPSWGKIGLTTHVSGTLGTGNGGTGLTSFTSGGVVYASSTSALATGSGLSYNGSQLSINTTTLSNAYLTINTVGSTGIDIFRSDVAANYTAFRFRDTTNTATYGSLGFDSAGLRINGDAGIIYFTGTSGADYARFDSSGRLLVGNTTNVQGSKIEATSTSLTPALLARVNVASDESQWAFQTQKKTSTNTTAQIFVRFLINDGATPSGYITANGANAATFTSSSDARLKENIVDLPSQLANILALQPVEFDYIDGSGRQIGFIAQQMQTIYPDSVSEGTDGMLQIGGWSKTEARLVKAIQEQQAIIEQLKTKIGL